MSGSGCTDRGALDDLRAAERARGCAASTFIPIGGDIARGGSVANPEHLADYPTAMAYWLSANRKITSE